MTGDTTEERADDHDVADALDDPRLQAGVDHLQRAAREMIAASRAFLDLVEEVVERPEGMSELAGMASLLGDRFARVVGSARGGRGTGWTGDEVGGAHDSDPGDDGSWQRIPVS